MIGPVYTCEGQSTQARVSLPMRGPVYPGNLFMRGSVRVYRCEGQSNHVRASRPMRGPVDPNKGQGSTQPTHVWARDDQWASLPMQGSMHVRASLPMRGSVNPCEGQSTHEGQTQARASLPK
jgi:hypothetical protein